MPPASVPIAFQFLRLQELTFQVLALRQILNHGRNGNDTAGFIEHGRVEPLALDDTFVLGSVLPLSVADYVPLSKLIPEILRGQGVFFSRKKVGVAAMERFGVRPAKDAFGAFVPV